MGKECCGSPCHQLGRARPQCGAGVRVSLDPSGRDILDRWRTADRGLVGRRGVRHSPAASGAGGVDWSAHATAVHDIWNRMPVGVRRRRALVVGRRTIRGGTAMQADGDLVSLRHAGHRLLSAATPGAIGLGPPVAGEGGMDCRCGSSELGDADYDFTASSDRSVGDIPALRPRVRCVRESDVLSVETGLAVSFVAQLSDVVRPFTRAVAGVGVGTQCCHDHGGGVHGKTPLADAGGGLGGVRDADFPCLRAHAGGLPSVRTAVCVRGDATVAAVGRRGRGMGVAALDDGSTTCAARLGGWPTVLLCGAHSRRDT